MEWVHVGNGWPNQLADTLEMQIRWARVMKRDLSEKLYRRAIKTAKCQGLGDEAEDFAGWIAKRWLEGKSQKQTLDQALCDYKRQHWGDTRKSATKKSGQASLKGSLKSKARFTSASIAPSGTQELGPGQIPHDLIQRPTTLEEINQDRNFAGFIHGLKVLSQIEKMFSILHFVWGFDGQEIAVVAGVSPSRVSQRLTLIKEKISRRVSSEEPGRRTKEEPRKIPQKIQAGPRLSAKGVSTLESLCEIKRPRVGFGAFAKVQEFKFQRILFKARSSKKNERPLQKMGCPKQGMES